MVLYTAAEKFECEGALLFFEKYSKTNMLKSCVLEIFFNLKKYLQTLSDVINMEVKLLNSATFS